MTHQRENEVWIADEAESAYVQMIDRRTQSQASEFQEIEDDIVDDILGKRSGYVKGLGSGRKPTRSKGSSTPIARVPPEVEEKLKRYEERMEHMEDELTRMKRIEDELVSHRRMMMGGAASSFCGAE